ncbi:hypothetical protein N7492_009076 [Penicillium capsulatum]|uniref:DNA 3'-5' helicase n=1 Tax=Penicillium capsulatum TaxID=69766 RepID=A0A9W9HTC6_9EURO|nr:hypothetical protein N7492_009076 [Penicillium capsulatum]KAJ6106475.1 hypothetical protein N7512_009992 [Penicillium capsulatum]
MRKNFFSQSSPFQPSPKRRRIDVRPASSSQGSRAGIIDQRLIESPQNLPSSGSFLHDTAPIEEPRSSPYQDSPLDAFDLELLAQEDRPEIPHQDGKLPQVTPQERVLANLDHQNAPQRSRFFNQSTSTTSSRPVNSGSPGLSSGVPSSPLAMIHKKQAGPWLDQNELEPHDSTSYETGQSSPELLFSFNRSPEESANRSLGRRGLPFENIPLSVRGIVLVSVQELPELHRSLFSFPVFNAVQSKCFHPAYKTNDNLVLSAPTGSGKTVIMELAICRLLNVLKDERFKVVYQAPTKSLCGERFRDWNTKFSSLNLKCAELTGDTDHTQLRSVQNSQIIITTPEKWDSMTRKWKDHMRLMQLVKLFLIDEVHILKEARGATLEAVVSRMKNIGSNIRFVALSATVPNSEDIATWLGKDATNQHVPAHREHFGEDFRPVKLQKFVYGYQSNGNDFAFDKVCGSKLPDVIGTHSCQKPIMIFCCTRNSSTITAKDLARLWTMTNPPAQLWKGPGRRIEVHNEDLQTTIAAGVAFHHAGLGPADRHAIEKGYLDGHINVICCTSTLAVGVNLPCHLVIIKNTVGWQEGGCKEYSDLEMMQMLGRAGRPQFDDSATAVILTRKERVAHYEKLVSGSGSLESCLHLNLIDHLNAEIGLGNVTNVETAIKWLAGTFLFVRLRRNPTYYKLKEGASEEDEDELLHQICEKDIKLLQECGLVGVEELRSTQFGDAMARYYVRFDTMKNLLSLQRQSTISQILDVIVQAAEFREIRLKAGEKSVYREINKDPGIRYPIKVDLALPAHKISLLLQFELGAIDFPSNDQFQKHKFSLQQDKSLVFAHVNRLIRCVIDCMIAREDSVSIRNALELARSFGARVWDHSPLKMKQIEQVGVVAVRKLAAAGITSIEALESTEAPRLEMILSKNPPFGTKLLARLKNFPKLRASIRFTKKDVRVGKVTIHFKIEVAFMNESIPTIFQRRSVYVCCLTETSDGRLIDFRRIGANKLQGGLEVTLVAILHDRDQYIVCHTMCDDIAGTARQAEIRPSLPSHVFPETTTDKSGKHAFKKLDSTTSQQDPSEDTPGNRIRLAQATYVLEENDVYVNDFTPINSRQKKPQRSVKENVHELDDIDWLSIDGTPSPPRRRPRVVQSTEEYGSDMGPQDEEGEPIRLLNGNWACNHKCKDKTRDGLDKPPKPSKKKSLPNPKNTNQLTLSASMNKKDSQKTTHKQSPPEPKSATKVRNRGSEAKASNKILSDRKGNDKSSITQAEPDKMASGSKQASSDYGDDTLDELSPAAWLFGSIGSSSAIPTANDTQNEQPGYIDLTTPGPQEDPLNTSSPTSPRMSLIQVDEPRTAVDETQDVATISGDLTGTWEGLTSEFEPEVSTSPANLISSATTVPLSTANTNVRRNPPSSVHTLENTPGESNQDFELSPYRKVVGEAQGPMHMPVCFTMKDFEESPSPEADEKSPGWEDIDRMLMEEYRDIVNFY